MTTSSNAADFVRSLQPTKATSMNSFAQPVATVEQCPFDEVVTDSDTPLTMPTTLELVELMLKHPRRLAALARDPSLQRAIMPRLLAIALVGFTGFGVALGIVMSIAGQWPTATQLDAYVGGRSTVLFQYEELNSGLAPWFDGSTWRLIAAYDFGLIAAVGICLPSFYFFGLLAGIRISMVDVVVQSVKAQAASAIALVGIVPIYAALVLAMLILPSDRELMVRLLTLGLALPFIAGLAGVRSLYVGLLGMADTLPAESRCRRACFLRRLLVSWCFVYTAVSPEMIYTVWRQLSSY